MSAAKHFDFLEVHIFFHFIKSLLFNGCFVIFLHCYILQEVTGQFMVAVDTMKSGNSENSGLEVVKTIIL